MRDYRGAGGRGFLWNEFRGKTEAFRRLQPGGVEVLRRFGPLGPFGRYDPGSSTAVAVTGLRPGRRLRPATHPFRGGR